MRPYSFLIYHLLLIFWLFSGSIVARATDMQAVKDTLYFLDRERWRDASLMADRARNPAFHIYTEWRIMSAKSTPASFADIIEFINKHPEWPKQDTLIRRAEEALSPGESEELVVRWFSEHPPQTPHGKWILGRLWLGNGAPSATRDIAISLLKEAWRDGDFPPEQEKEFLNTYSAYFDEKNHADRIDRLLWQGSLTSAKKLLDKVSPSHRTLFEARIKLQTNQKDINSALQRVPASYTKNPGLLFDRLTWRAEYGTEAGIKEILSIVPENVPYPERWWPIREKAIWKLLDKKEYKSAYALAKKHGQKEGKTLAEAEWLAGWIAYSHLKDANAAYTHFYTLHSVVKFPVSIARAAYWAGRAAEVLKKQDIADKWFAIAAKHPTTFYGQLSRLSIESPAILSLPAEATPSESTLHTFKQSDFYQLAHLLEAAGRADLAKEWILHLVDSSPNAEGHVLAAKLGSEIGRQDFTVKAAKEALKKGTIMAKTGYPLIVVPSPPIEEALVLGITRQESEFYTKAESPAGALGLMQLLPSTAKQMAKELDISFADYQLTASPATNLKLGSYYISKLLRRYNGCLILAVAAYNAGPGNVDKWLTKNGNPSDNRTDPVRWIENIPFTETRNYVQRVLENLQVYRLILSGKQSTHLRLAEDLGLVGVAAAFIPAPHPKPTKPEKPAHQSGAKSK